MTLPHAARQDMLEHLQRSLDASIKLADALELTLVGINISEALSNLDVAVSHLPVPYDSDGQATVSPD